MVNRRTFTHRSEGQAIIVVALAMVVLLALAGLAVDGSRAFEERRHAVNAADAAALAATNTLAEVRRNGGDGTAINDTVLDALTEHNLASAQSLSWDATYTTTDGTTIAPVVDGGAVPSTARGIRVELNYTFDTFLMPLMGQNTLPADSDATAVYGPLWGPPYGGDLLPVTLSYATALDMMANPGDTAIFGTGTGMYKGSPGAFGAVQLIPNANPNNPTGNYGQCTGGPVTPPATAPDNQNYWWCNGTPHDISVGDLVYNDPGNISSLGSAVQYRIDNSPIGLVPIFDLAAPDPGGNTSYRIVGFIAVELTDQDLTGPPADRHISANYIDFFVTTGAINPNPSALDTGVYAINLID